MKGLTIGKVAKAAGVNVETIRYYERLGLLPEPMRKSSVWGHGYRMYQEKELNQLLFIREAKNLGFSLKEIKELLSLRVDKRSNCERIREKTERKLADVQDKISKLMRLRKSLQRLIKACKERKVTDPCPILKALNNRDEKFC